MDAMGTGPNLITKKQYAELVGVSPPCVHQWQENGNLPADCIVNVYGREMIDLEKTKELGVFDRHNKRRESPQIAKAQSLFDDDGEVRPRKTADWFEQHEPKKKPRQYEAKAPLALVSEPDSQQRTKSKEFKPEDDLYSLERMARIKKLQAEAEIAIMNQKRAEGLLLDTDKVTPLLVDFCEKQLEYYNQFIEQISSAFGGSSNPEIKKTVKEKVDQLISRSQALLEKKKTDLRHLPNLQQKSLKL
jgi:hypothetical protein